MAKTFDLTKMRKLLKIYTVVQVLLVALLIFMAVNFQAGLQAEGRPQRFMHSVIVTLVIQLALFYPLSKYATSDANREIEGSVPGLTVEEQKALRQKRLFSDFMKGAIFIFFVTFILRAPQERFILSVIFFTFILTILTYFQCFNFTVKRKIKELG